MRKISTILMASAVSVMAVSGYAKDDAHHLDFTQAIQNATAAGALDGSVKFYLAGTKTGGQLIEKEVITNKKTNGFAKSAETACDWAVRSALIQLQNSAKAKGANAVTDIVSYFKRNEYRDSKNYECFKGTAIASVALKGNLVKF